MSNNAGPSTIPAASFYSSTPKPTFGGVPRGHPSAGSAAIGPISTPLRPSSTFAKKRSASPEEDERPLKQARPTGSWGTPGVNGNGTFARVKSEEDLKRREREGEGNGAPAEEFTATRTGERYQKDESKDLIGRGYAREVLAKHLPPNSTIPEDVLTYLSTATETYLRTVLRSSLSAQVHRTCTSHTRAPPFATTSSSSGSKRTKLSYDPDSDGKPLWSHSITSDPSLVIELLSKQNREAELAFRASRMDRIAKEKEMRTMQVARAQREAEAQGLAFDAVAYAASLSAMPYGTMPPPPLSAGLGGVAQAGDQSEALAPGTPSVSTQQTSSDVGLSTTPATASAGPAAPPSSSPAPATPAPSTPSGPPVFGARKTGTGKKYNPKNPSMSLDTQMKISNATASRAAGVTKKYSWMSNAPNTSSPLAGKKKNVKSALGGTGTKGDEESGDESAASVASGSGGGLFGVARVKKKSKLSQSMSGAGMAEGFGGNEGAEGKRKKRALGVNVPTRRTVLVSNDMPDPGSSDTGLTVNGPPVSSAEGITPEGTKQVSDDRAICVSDVMFALKRDRGGVDAQGVIRRATEKLGRERRDDVAGGYRK